MLDVFLKGASFVANETDLFRFGKLCLVVVVVVVDLAFVPL